MIFWWKFFIGFEFRFGMGFGIFGFDSKSELGRKYEFAVSNGKVQGDISVEYLKNSSLGDNSDKCSCRESLKIVYELKGDDNSCVLTRGCFHIEKRLGGMSHVSDVIKKEEDEKINSDVLEVLAHQLPSDIMSIILREIR